MDTPTAERFCSRCGESLVPLDGFHVSRKCSDCDRTKYVARPGERGKGVQIETGDQIHFPMEWLSTSLDPASARGRLTRAGVPFHLKQVFLAPAPRNVGDIADSVRKHRDAIEAELSQSDKLAGIDLKSPEGGDAAMTRIMAEPDCAEKYLLLEDVSAANVQDAIEEKDAEKAAFSALQMGLMHGLSLVAQPHFEETIWRGYQANVAIHEAATAAEHVPGEAEALAELDPLFERLGEATLRTWTEANVPIGPRIAVKAIPEPLLLARAKWHLAEFERKREDAMREPAEKRARAELRIKWLTLIGTALSGGVAGVLITKWIGGS